MKPELREKILAYNRSVREKGEKAADLDLLVEKLTALPPGQLKKVLTEDVLEILRKYGVVMEA